LPVRPLGRRDAPAQLSDIVFGNVGAERADHAAFGHCAGFCVNRACASGARVRNGGYGHVRLLALRLQAPANRCSVPPSWQLWSRSRGPVGPGHTLADTLVPIAGDPARPRWALAASQTRRPPRVLPGSARRLKSLASIPDTTRREAAMST